MEDEVERHGSRQKQCNLNVKRTGKGGDEEQGGEWRTRSRLASTLFYITRHCICIFVLFVEFVFLPLPSSLSFLFSFRWRLYAHDPYEREREHRSFCLANPNATVKSNLRSFILSRARATPSVAPVCLCTVCRGDVLQSHENASRMKTKGGCYTYPRMYTGQPQKYVPLWESHQSSRS